MKKLIEFVNTTFPYFWATCWIIIITAGSFGLAVSLIKWALNLLGVL